MQFENKIKAAIKELEAAHPRSFQREQIKAMLNQAALWEKALRDGLPVDEIKEVA